MEIIEIENRSIQFGSFEITDVDKLSYYLNNLSNESKGRFGPHAFTCEAISELYKDANNYKLFTAKTIDEDDVIAYTIIKLGWLHFEIPRLSSYGLKEEPFDCTLAPSVADAWQGCGIGTRFLSYLIKTLKTEYQLKRIFLWGGVQSDNTKAVNLYKKFGFAPLGYFEYHGWNVDMLLNL
ncbi:MAG: GNAT family N-acetyltransferase [Bacteroidales bacterium]|nr:GNAT family N-acetyltransferase [Bacteroidales bacterium]